MRRRPSISSNKNPAVARVRDAATGRRDGELVVEGVRFVQEALDAGLRPEFAAVSPKVRAHRAGHDLERRLEQRSVEFADCTDQVLAKMSGVETHQGVIAVLRRPDHDLGTVLAARPPALVVVAAAVKDPGNLGALVRVAEAAGASGVIATRDGADPFREKAVRAAAGSGLRLPLVGGEDLEHVLDAVRDAGLRIVAADGRGEQDYPDADWRAPTALVVGGEGPGLPAAVLERADSVVRVPMAAPVDSLNVAVATGVILYEARRQRR